MAKQTKTDDDINLNALFNSVAIPKLDELYGRMSNQEQEEMVLEQFSPATMDKLFDVIAAAVAEALLMVRPFEYIWAERVKFKQQIQAYHFADNIPATAKRVTLSTLIFEQLVALETERKKKKALAEIEAWKILTTAQC